MSSLWTSFAPCFQFHFSNIFFLRKLSFFKETVIIQHTLATQLATETSSVIPCKTLRRCLVIYMFHVLGNNSRWNMKEMCWPLPWYGWVRLVRFVRCKIANRLSCFVIILNKQFCQITWAMFFEFVSLSNSKKRFLCSLFLFFFFFLFFVYKFSNK